MTTNSLSTCCETSGRSLADSGAAPSTQTPVYCPVYESRLLATARHELNSAAALGVYGNPYTNTQGYGNYVTYGTEASAFYSLVSLCHCCALNFLKGSNEAYLLFLRDLVNYFRKPGLVTNWACLDLKISL